MPDSLLEIIILLYVVVGWFFIRFAQTQALFYVISDSIMRPSANEAIFLAYFRLFQIMI